MAMRTITLLVLAAGAADALLLSGGAASSRTLSHPRMSAADNQPAPARKVKVELLEDLVDKCKEMGKDIEKCIPVADRESASSCGALSRALILHVN